MSCWLKRMVKTIGLPHKATVLHRQKAPMGLFPGKIENDLKKKVDTEIGNTIEMKPIKDEVKGETENGKG